mmetsp:Transcript_60012/g.170673  ORF Transcript_60012/g.170673 Transcript_60012/m.170673 type:complete len:102 (+) Transcript_60012:376-681(+)
MPRVQLCLHSAHTLSFAKHVEPGSAQHLLTQQFSPILAQPDTVQACCRKGPRPLVDVHCWGTPKRERATPPATRARSAEAAAAARAALPQEGVEAWLRSAS